MLVAHGERQTDRTGPDQDRTRKKRHKTKKKRRESHIQNERTKRDLSPKSAQTNGPRQPSASCRTLSERQDLEPKQERDQQVTNR